MEMSKSKIIRPKLKKSPDENTKTAKTVDGNKNQKGKEFEDASAQWSDWVWNEESGFYYRARKVDDVWQYEYTPPLAPTVLKEEKVQPAIEYKPPQTPATVKTTAPTYVLTPVEYPKQESALLYAPEPKYVLAQGNIGDEYVLKDVYGNATNGALEDVAQASSHQIEREEKVGVDGDRGEDKENRKDGVDAKVERKITRVARVDQWRQHVTDALKEGKKPEKDSKAKKKHSEKESKHRERR